MDEKTQELLDIFKEVSAIPRCSVHEKDIALWLGQWAKKNVWNREPIRWGMW